MEVQFLSFPFFFSFLLFLFTVFKIVKRQKANNSNPNLPPGPRKLPLIGNLHQLESSLPYHRALRKLSKKYGPIMHLQLGEVSTVVLSSLEMAKEIMKTHDISFAQRPLLPVMEKVTYGFQSIGFSPNTNYWRQIRKICTQELLGATRVLSFRALREEGGSKFIKEISSHEGSQVNLTEKIFSFSYSNTSRAAFGYVRKDQDEFIAIITELAKLSAGFSLADVYPSSKVLQFARSISTNLENVFLQSDRILTSILNEHKESRMVKKTSNEEAGEDLVDVLLNLQEHGDLEFPLTDNHIKAVIWDIFSAGSETSASAIEWAFSEMLKNPRVMKKAQTEVRQVFGSKGSVDEAKFHELKYMKLVIKETLRLHPPVPMLLPRENNENCKIGGYDIPVKTRIVVNAWAIGRDPKYWPEAETFNPERFLDSSIDYKGTDFEYIPFGAGRRICPGILFALPTVELPLAQMLYHFDWKLPNGVKLEDLDMTEDIGLGLRKKNDLVVVPIPYHPVSVK